MAITVEPPLWKTWWAYAIYLIAALALLYYIIELYIADKRSRMMAEQENLKRQKEQHLDELKFRFFTNISHELRTPLALIITPLELLIRKAGDSALKSELERYSATPATCSSLSTSCSISAVWNRKANN